MVSLNTELPISGWTNENFREWVHFIKFYFIINNVDEEAKHSYILLSTGPKCWEVIKNAKLTTEEKENLVNMFQIFETEMVQKPNK